MDGDRTLGAMDADAGCGPLLSDDIAQQKPMRQRIFEHVRAQGHAARADVTRALGISPGSATTLTAELIITPEIFAQGLSLLLPFELRHFGCLVLLQTGCAIGEHLVAGFFKSHF